VVSVERVREAYCGRHRLVESALYALYAIGDVYAVSIGGRR